MTDQLDESQDWPLRDYSARLRPPARADEAEPESYAAASEPDSEHAFAPEREPEPGPAFTSEPEPEPEPSMEPPPAASEAEVLYDEDDPPAATAVPEVEEPEAPPEDEPEPVAPPEEDEPEPEPEDDEIVPAAEEPEPVEEPELLAQDVEGDLRIPDGYSVLEGSPDGRRRTVAIVVSRFNGEITNGLLESALSALEEAGVARDAVLVMPVPGAFELPIAAMALAKTRRYSCVVALGAVIRGETPHFDYIAGEAASGLQLAGIETGVPVSFGLLTCDTAEQAEARVDRGAWAARTALEMADAFAQLRTAVARG
jgi:6,7-dimethyl-8-ribityllumazine synthase